MSNAFRLDLCLGSLIYPYTPLIFCDVLPLEKVSKSSSDYCFRVSKCSSSNVISNEAYLLFFELSWPIAWDLCPNWCHFSKLRVLKILCSKKWHFSSVIAMKMDLGKCDSLQIKVLFWKWRKPSKSNSRDF